MALECWLCGAECLAVSLDAWLCDAEWLAVSLDGWLCGSGWLAVSLKGWLCCAEWLAECPNVRIKITVGCIPAPHPMSAGTGCILE